MLLLTAVHFCNRDFCAIVTGWFRRATSYFIYLDPSLRCILLIEETKRSEEQIEYRKEEWHWERGVWLMFFFSSPQSAFVRETIAPSMPKVKLDIGGAKVLAIGTYDAHENSKNKA